MTSDPVPAATLTTVYGLTIASDLPLPELASASAHATPDIVIRRGAVHSPSTDDPRDLRAFIDGGPRRLWLNIPGVIRMEMCGGRQISYAPGAATQQDELRLFLLGSGLSALMMQRGHVVIHGNAMRAPGTDGAIVCIGDSGAGKSTTAVAMTQRDWQILADDICVLDDAGAVLPGMARAKLWEDTARQLGLETTLLSRIRSADAKFHVPLGGAHCAAPQSVRAFCWLVPADVATISIAPVRGAEKFTVLRNNVYRPAYLRTLALEADYLERLAGLAATTPVFKILRPRDGFDIDGLRDVMCAHAATLAEAASAQASVAPTPGGPPP